MATFAATNTELQSAVTGVCVFIAASAPRVVGENDGEQLAPPPPVALLDVIMLAAVLDVTVDMPPIALLALVTASVVDMPPAPPDGPALELPVAPPPEELVVASLQSHLLYPVPSSLHV